MYNIKMYDLCNLKFLKNIKIKKLKCIKNKFLLYFYFKKYLSNKRFSTANTKNRSLIRGSNKKICKQKGLGVARKGSIKNPLFKGGGVIFGPTNKKKYNIKINKKIIKKSYIYILNEKIINDEIIIINNFYFINNSIKKIIKFINKFFYLNDKFLFILKEKKYNIYKKYKNYKNIKIILYNNINIFLLKKYKYIIFDSIYILKKIYNK
ncbi:MAG: 50S ribosomal protein L4 [Candidatus Shikimatogenerans sp. Tduv]|uniref:Large ribosomal subunit protein uL4 n=1 Tax=Candidatus Shikimatogenerans sp. Tduv TaxID=3158567 RepID=A0AAU7QR82_9FLAO